MDALSKLCNIIAEELLKESYFKACLPASLMFCDEARKMKYEPTLVIGNLIRKPFPIPIIHFVVKIENKIFDPMREASLQYSGLSPEDYEFIECDNVQANSIEQVMMKLVYENYKVSRDSERYFDKAPETLKKIRRRVQQRTYRMKIEESKFKSQ